MSIAQRFVAVVVATIVVAGALLLTLRLAGVPIGIGGDPSAAPSVAASATPAESLAPDASAGPSASAIPDAELLAILGEIEEEVVAIRGLPPADIGPPELLTRSEFRDVLEAMLEADYPPEDRERDNRVLRALGLITPEQDIAALQLELLGEGVLGFYDDDEERMVVVTDAGLDVEAKITYAHEYAHALQDAAFDLGFLDEDVVEDDDAYLARLALVEGDATLTMFAWAFANLSQEELQEYALGAELPDTSGIPSWMVDQVLFSYEDGLAFTSALAGNPFTPNFGPIDEAFGAPPDSTEQVLDPTLDAWLEREAPVEVEPIDAPAVLGEGWSEVEATTMGQAMIEIMLEYFGAASDDAAAAADGWGGDRLTVAYGPDDAFVAGWRLAWDETADADEFAAAYGAATGDLGFPVRVLAVDDGDVVVLHASSEDLIDRVVGSLD